MPVGQVSPALAASLVAGTGRSFDDLSKAAETAKGFTPLPLPGARVELHTAVDRHIVPDRNVVGLIEGSDPTLKDQWVIVCAHYDHEGADGAQIANRPVGLVPKPRYDNNASNLVRRSDQWPFLQHGVPAVGSFTGLHPDYHTPYDRPEKINYEKLETIARLVHQASWNLANQASRPRAATTTLLP